MICIFLPCVKAQELELTQYLELAKVYNIDIEEAKSRSYIGCSFEQARNSAKPYLVVFADFEDVLTAASYVNNGYFVYNNLQHTHGFTVLNVNHPDNAKIVQAIGVRTLPYVVVIYPQKDKILPIKPELYENPKRMVYLLRAYYRKNH